MLFLSFGRGVPLAIKRHDPLTRRQEGHAQGGDVGCCIYWLAMTASSRRAQKLSYLFLPIYNLQGDYEADVCRMCVHGESLRRGRGWIPRRRSSFSYPFWVQLYPCWANSGDVIPISNLHRTSRSPHSGQQSKSFKPKPELPAGLHLSLLELH